MAGFGEVGLVFIDAGKCDEDGNTVAEIAILGELHGAAAALEVLSRLTHDL